MAQLSFSAGNPFLRKDDITRIKLRFRNYDVDKVLDRFGFSIQMIPDGDWHFTTTVAAEPTDEFYGWLFATRAVESGMDLRTLSEILGHTKVSLTLQLYAHSTMETKVEAMNCIEKYL